MGDEYKEVMMRNKQCDSVASTPMSNNEGSIHAIILKFTTLSEANTEAPSFTVDKKGAYIGRSSDNEVSVPSDARLTDSKHAYIQFEDGSFYLVDGGHECAASLRIGVGVNAARKWTLTEHAKFSAGNSIFHCCGVNVDGDMVLKVQDGPLEGQEKIITKLGATIGRSSDNIISVPDRELSRRHSQVSYDEELKKFVISDVGSTNGTYVQLVGPYEGRYRLHINDHILVGRTGFSINRFDYGISEEIGHRQTMEDSCAIVQHLNVKQFSGESFCELFPQSFFAVYDGHGGADASAFLARTLHVRVSESLTKILPELREKLTQQSIFDLNADSPNKEESRKLIVEALKKTFNETDDEFIQTSEYAQHGSTATTAILLGRWLFCANTGDSRTLLCREFKAVPMSHDHKPSREDEAQRIRNSGGFVINNRVMGELAVSRAFGDCEFKKGIQSIIEEEGHIPLEGMENQDWDKPLIIPEPDVETTIIDDSCQFLLLACDGLFDVFTADEIVEFVRTNMEEHGDTQLCCQNLTYEAIRKRNSRDNVSVILVILNRWY